MFFLRTQHFHITVHIAMEVIEFFYICTKNHISAVAFDIALRVLNPLTKELTYLLQICDQERISTALNYALRVLASEMLKSVIELHESERIGDEAIYLALCVLRPAYVRKCRINPSRK